MAQSTDQTPIRDKIWRRHTDPPSLWIGVVTGSVALHLLLFWLMRSSNAFSLWFPQQQSQAFIPIEVIDISTTSIAKPQLKAKTAYSKPRANRQSLTTLRERSPLTTKTQNNQINLGVTRQQRKNQAFVSKLNTQLIPKQSVSTPTPTPIPITTSTPTGSLGNFPRKSQRQKVAFGKSTPLPTYTPDEPQRQLIADNSPTPNRRTPRQPIADNSPTPNKRTPRQPIADNSPTPNRKTSTQPIADNSPTPNRRTPRQPIADNSPTPNRKTSTQPIESDALTPNRRTPRQPIESDAVIPNRRTSRQPIGDNSPTASGRTSQPPTRGGIIASWSFVNIDEQTRLMGSPLPEGVILPEYPINQIPIDSIDLVEGEFVASLVIDKNGTVQPEITIYESKPPKQKSKYQQLANQIFPGKKFQPARSTNGKPLPELINRFVRIKIQPR